jgi:hypothetical protein
MLSNATAILADSVIRCAGEHAGQSASMPMNLSGGDASLLIYPFPCVKSMRFVHYSTFNWYSPIPQVSHSSGWWVLGECVHLNRLERAA